MTAGALCSDPALARRTADRSMPAAFTIASTIPEARDVAWPGGTILLSVDATDTQRALWRVKETVPVASGTSSLVLMLPKWIPGDHEPSGRIDQIADLSFTVDGQPLAWQRDRIDVFAFHLVLPPGARQIVAHFVHTSPLTDDEGQITMTAAMLNLEWSHMLLYPAGYYVRRIPVQASVIFPKDWTAASALDGATRKGDTISWSPTDIETLVDSPVFAGVHFRRFDLGHDVALNVVADRDADLSMETRGLTSYRALVEEAFTAFGGHHFDHYDFLLGLSEHLGRVGLEHHRSSENQAKPRELVDWSAWDWDRDLLPHEFTHSWNGKFRRPADLWTPDYRRPMQDDLLWVYEGQTQFWGNVLGARSDVRSKKMVLGEWAETAGHFTQWPGRGWRSVEDTTNDPVMNGRTPKPFASIERDEDYYTEGALVWLEADQIIRAGTRGQRGLDDFARRFFGIRDGDWGEVTYQLDDVITTLNAIYSYDWAGFFNERIATPGQPAPLGGIEKGGYQLVWKDKPNPYTKARDAQRKILDLSSSLGIILDKDGKVTACRWGSAAFDAGIVPDAKISAVDGLAYSIDTIRDAITTAKNKTTPISLVIERQGRISTVTVDYHDGLRWPWLERTAPGKEPTGIDLLLAPHRKDISRTKL